MKTAVLTVTVLALGAATMMPVRAGDREWATAGKVLTGVVAIGVIAHALQPHGERTVVYQAVPETVVYAPVPRPFFDCPAPRVLVAPVRVVYVSAPLFHRAHHPHFRFEAGW